MQKTLSDTLTRNYSPLVKPVIDRLAWMIRDGKMKPGDRLPSIRALANDHGVSFTTARTAVTCLEQQGLLVTFQGSGTYVRGHDPGAKPGQQTAETVYLFLDRRPQVSGELSSVLTAKLKDFHIPMMQVGPVGTPYHPSQMRFIEDFQRRPPRAMVLHHVDKYRDEVVRAASAGKVRVITSFRTGLWELPGWHTVNPDYWAAFNLAARYAIAQGHRRIGMVAKARRVVPNWPHTQRLSWMLETQQIRGAGAALRDAGRSHRMSIHYNRPDPDDPDPSGLPIDEQNVAHMAEWLDGPDRPTAVIGDDYRLLGLRRAARRVGLVVGKDLLLVGVGCSLLSRGAGFPCVDLRIREVANQTVQLILADDRELAGNVRHVKVPPRLVDGDGEPIEGFQS